MRKIDCKVIDAKIGHANVKVQVVLAMYTLTVEVVGDYDCTTSTIKSSDYTLVKQCFTRFDETDANEFAKRAWINR